MHGCCWAHAWRKYGEAHKLSPGESTATGIVLLIDELFGVDAEARAQGLDLAARDALRPAQARPLLETIRAAIEVARTAAFASSRLARAIKCTLALWPKLTCFLNHSVLQQPSNHLTENSMRPVVLGRKNWIHVGSAQAGPKVASILSIVETCRRLRIPIREYLAAVLPGLANVSIQKLPELTPAAWGARRR